MSLKSDLYGDISALLMKHRLTQGGASSANETLLIEALTQRLLELLREEQETCLQTVQSQALLSKQAGDDATARALHAAADVIKARFRAVYEAQAQPPPDLELTL